MDLETTAVFVVGIVLGFVAGAVWAAWVNGG